MADLAKMGPFCLKFNSFHGSYVSANFLVENTRYMDDDA